MRRLFTVLFVVGFILGFSSESTANEDKNQAEPCYVHRSPCHVDTRIEMAGIKDPAVLREFLDKLQAAALAKNQEALASMIEYPLVMYDQGEELANYPDQKSLLSGFNEVFNDRVITAILNTQYDDLLVNSQGVMIGNGEIWIDGWGTEIEAGSEILIKTINP